MHFSSQLFVHSFSPHIRSDSLPFDGGVVHTNNLDQGYYTVNDNMARRKQQQSRKGRSSAIRKIRTDYQPQPPVKVQKQCSDSNDYIKLNLSRGKMNERHGAEKTSPSTYINTTTINSTRSSRIRRRARRLTSTRTSIIRTTASSSSPTTPTTTIIIPPTTTSTLPIAIYYYPSTSLFIMLVVASLLPRHTFSLRWLALSGGVGIGGEGIGGARALGLVRNGGLNNNDNYNRVVENIDDVLSCQDTIMKADDSESSLLLNRKIMLALWNEVTLVLENTMMETITAASLSTTLDDEEDDRQDCWSIDFILNSIPRGGGGRRGRRNNNNLNHNEEDEKKYAGLINLGNTCYLNAQLQCAYHVPYLRELIKVAKDEIVQVEVEYEVEVDDDEDEEETQVKEEQVSVDDEGEEEGNGIDESQMAPESSNTGEDVMNTESIEAEADYVPMLDNELPTSGGEEKEEADDESALPSSSAKPKKKKIIIEKEMKEEIEPISHALQALKVVFNTLTHPSGGGGSGSTTVLCRTLGINPYLQQDGQEFWKLFVPELDYDKLAKLYSGYFEDYVREIVPNEENESGSMDEEDGVYGEEKKEENEDESAVLEDGDDKARERVRTEPFLDLSIPVAEGIGGSVESTLQEMFTQPEILSVSEGNGWRPSKGADKVDAYKGSSLKLDGLPSLLQLHLKRFKYDWETGETSKINDCCSFPMELDLSDIISESDREDDIQSDDATYDLQSIVIHKGEYGSGHYYSYVRPDIRSDDWYRFDDEFVTKVDYSDVVADAYGGSRQTRRKRPRSDSFESSDTAPVAKRRRGPFQLIFSFFGLFRRVARIGSNTAGGRGDGGVFGYGGRTSNAYMLQYVRRSHIPKLYLEQ